MLGMGVNADLDYKEAQGSCPVLGIVYFLIWVQMAVIIHHAVHEPRVTVLYV